MSACHHCRFVPDALSQPLEWESHNMGIWRSHCYRPDHGCDTSYASYWLAVGRLVLCPATSTCRLVLRLLWDSFSCSREGCVPCSSTCLSPHPSNAISPAISFQCWEVKDLNSVLFSSLLNIYFYISSDLSLSRVQRPKVSAWRYHSLWKKRTNREIIEKKEKK